MNHNHREYTRISTTSPASTPLEHGTINDDGSSAAEIVQQYPPQPTTSTSALPPSLPSRTMTELITDKCFAAIWVVVASLIFHYTDSSHVYLLTDDSNYNTTENNSLKPTTANVLLMQLVMIGLGINTVLFGYLLIYLPYVKGLHDSTAWDVYCPRVIPCMTLIGIGIFILLIRATYPIWGFLAPIIISIEAMGALFVCHFIPVGFV